MEINNPNFKFVVVGGGTAGWLTALKMKTMNPQSSVTVIESADIGILGAGEGTTPHFHDFLKAIDVDFSDFVKQSHATVKNGIKFTNWNGDGDCFFHPFSDNQELSYANFYHDSRQTIYAGFNALVMDLLQQGKTMDQACFSAITSYNDQVRYQPLTSTGSKSGQPITHFRQLGVHAWHFDANLLAQYLKSVGVQRGIRLVIGTVTDIISKENGNISRLLLDNQDPVDCDFVFDCTGFRRLLIGRHFKSNWRSWQKHLPVKRALPFFLPETSQLPPYTESIAMKHGWVWRIPVQGRYGCGYVFDSNRISDDQAHDELVDWSGTDIVSPRTFSFEPGAYEKTWMGNCVALGLSTGFIEPLEATSIWVTITSLNMFFTELSGVIFDDQKSRDRFNHKVFLLNEHIMHFIYFHYMTQRKDSDFWTRFKLDNIMPEGLAITLEQASSLDFSAELHTTTVFGKTAYIAVGAGTKFFDRQQAEMRFLTMIHGEGQQLYQRARQDFLRNIYLNSRATISHRWFLNYVMTGRINN